MQPQSIISSGLCHCGCGQQTRISPRTDRRCGHIAGQPMWYILGHHERLPLAERFWTRVSRCGPDDCWPWQGGINSSGYGYYWYESKGEGAHRVAWILTNGPIPDGLLICHNCDVRYPVGDLAYRKCCNPAHLFLGTNAGNLADMATKDRAASGDRNGARLYPERRARGERHHSAKLTAEQVITIRHELDRGASQQRLALEYAVTPCTISQIHCRRTWKHLA